MAKINFTEFQGTYRVSRRELLRAGSLGLLGLTLPELLAGRTARQALAAPVNSSSFGRAKSCIFLCMWGGPAHQDTWDLKPAASVEYRGEFQPISTDVPGIQICEHFPLLSRRVGKLALVRSMTHNNADHLSATHFVLTGQAPPTANGARAEWPHLGAVLSRLGRGHGALPPFVSMRPKLENTVPRFVEQSRGQGGGWLGPEYDPLAIDHDPSKADYHVGEFSLPPDLSLERLEDRRHLLATLKDLGRRAEADEGAEPAYEGLDDYQRRAFNLLNSAVAGRAFDLREESAATRERYGSNAHGQSVLQARRLIERGVPLVSIYWPNDGIKNVSVYWDTHSRNFIDLRERLMPVADQAFSALLEDLDARGLLDETLIVWTGEFGRTPRVGQRNSDAGAGSDGRDHWPGCFTSVLAGGGVRGGQVYGASDRYAAYPALNPVAPADLVATAYHCLGVDESQTLPDRQGRPQIIRPGRPLLEVLG